MLPPWFCLLYTHTLLHFIGTLSLFCCALFRFLCSGKKQLLALLVKQGHVLLGDGNWSNASAEWVCGLQIAAGKSLKPRPLHTPW